VFHSVPGLIESIRACLDTTNTDPQPFIRIATAEVILAKVGHGRGNWVCFADGGVGSIRMGRAGPNAF